MGLACAAPWVCKIYLCSKPPWHKGKADLHACVVTWCNPQAILDGTMMLGAFRVTLPPQESGAFIPGVASASCLWFLALTTVIQLFSARISDRTLRIMHVACGCIILFYGRKRL